MFPFLFSLFVALIILFWYRAPLQVGGSGLGASGAAFRNREAQAAMPPLITDVVMGDTVLPDAAPVVADLDPTTPKGGDEAAVEDFTMVPRAQVETNTGAGSAP